MSEGATKRPLEDWRAAQLRVTAFVAPDVLPVGQRDLWAELGLPEPDSRETKKGRQVTTQGPALDNWLVLTHGLGRVDWVYLPEPESVKELEGFRDVGTFPDAVSKFTELLRDWLSRSPDLTRLAFGATFQLPVPDRVQGYRQLSCYLPFEIDAEASSDFSYQINRPRDSKAVQGIRVNRLTRWSVVVMNLLHARLGAGVTVQHTQLGFACQVVLDINSILQEGVGFKSEQVLPLLGEFCEMAQEILEEGDAP